MIPIYKRVQNASYAIKKRVKTIPKMGMVLGTGLQGLIEAMDVETEIPYADIPHFPIPSVVSHGASMIFGKMNGQYVVVLSGRFHYYEGYSMEEVTFGIRVLAHLGIVNILMTNITGSVNPDHKIGDLVIIKDHINLQSANPLRPVTEWHNGIQSRAVKHDTRLGSRFPSMIDAYDAALRKRTNQLAVDNDIKIVEGVYAAMDGPSLETPAEYKMISILGGDVVGMSTVPEVIVARQVGLRVQVISIVSNTCYPFDAMQEDDIDTILRNVEIGVPHLKKLIYAILQSKS